MTQFRDIVTRVTLDKITGEYTGWVTDEAPHLFVHYKDGFTMYHQPSGKVVCWPTTIDHAVLIVDYLMAAGVVPDLDTISLPRSEAVDCKAWNTAYTRAAAARGEIRKRRWAT